jgi:hypothetical protein
MKDKIELQRFDVKRIDWGKNEGSYLCRAEFSIEGMNFTINLNADLGNALLAICRGKIAEKSQDALSHLIILAKRESL